MGCIASTKWMFVGVGMMAMVDRVNDVADKRKVLFAHSVYSDCLQEPGF